MTVLDPASPAGYAFTSPSPSQHHENDLSHGNLPRQPTDGESQLHGNSTMGYTEGEFPVQPKALRMLTASTRRYRLYTSLHVAPVPTRTSQARPSASATSPHPGDAQPIGRVYPLHPLPTPYHRRAPSSELPSISAL